MNTNQIKLILMNYSEDDYVPELGGIYTKDRIEVKHSELYYFIYKHKLKVWTNTIPIFRCNVETGLSFVFYMNLLNFNGYSSWRIKRYSNDEYSDFVIYRKI